MYASEKTSGLCYGHYNQWLKENDPAKLDAAKDKRAATISAKKDEAAENHDKLVNESGENPGKFGIDSSIIEAMGLNIQTSLEEELALYKSLNLGEGQENYDEKMAYARWLSTPESKRNPRSIEAAAKILCITKATLELWRRSPELTKFKSRNAEAMLENAYSLVVYKTLQGIDRLDYRFFKIYQELLKDVRVKSPTNNFPKLPDSLVKQAEKRNEESGRSQMHGSLNDIEKNAVFGAVRDGDVEIEQ
jgi:hypothetical protein